MLQERFSIEPIFENSGHGVKTRISFHKGDILFRIPRENILTVDEASADLAELLRKDKLLSAMPNVCLALLVLHLKTSTKKGKRWQPYLNILPTEFSTPLYFSLDEIKSLQSSHCFSNAYF